MSRSFVLIITVFILAPVSAEAQLGTPGEQYSHTIAAGEGGQLYPYDQQDPWLHGQYQRVPAYGGFASFRPYNYRHVFAQTQIATTWGMPHSLPYSQQFWNRYRGSYLHGDLHSAQAANPPQTATEFTSYPEPNYWQQPPQSLPVSHLPSTTRQQPMNQFQQVHHGQSAYPLQPANPESDRRPIHVFPASVQSR